MKRSMAVIFVVVSLLVAQGARGLASVTTRRSFGALALMPVGARAMADDVVVSGVVTLGGSDEPPEETAALYITVKKGAAPQEFAGLVRGAPAPALGAVRVTKAQFPYTFAITRSDLFPEFANVDVANLALTVSARLDADGVAATRGPDDLVASTFIDGKGQRATLDLKPRGVVKNFMATK
mmetsp:Transcript_34663/g.111243  ORF Transcript_34663/g.111243 Transcript_34663/m.111243 type:complete len:181 (+) Transcript_34663:1-543(+)